MERDLRDARRALLAGLRWLGRPLLVTPHNLADEDQWALVSHERLDGSVELSAVKVAHPSLGIGADGAGDGR
ncbi:MAG: hypothetical protein U0667_15445 [Chloroflexota bacterium]